MLGNTGVESISRELFRTFDQDEPGFWNDQMKKAALAANRAVAFERFDFRGSVDLESHPAAVASADVFRQNCHAEEIPRFKAPEFNCINLPTVDPRYTTSIIIDRD